MRKLPEWQRLSKYYPAHQASMVAHLIGGKVKLNYDIGVFSNFCAIRVSRALNMSGQPIPFIEDIGFRGKLESQVSSGANGRWHIFRVRQLVKYLNRQYGRPEIHGPGVHEQAVRHRKGIIVYEVHQWTDASGHADLWDGTQCLWKGYGSVATNVLFWQAS